MNAGLSNLAALKLQLLGPSLNARTDWDALITSIGRGMAGLINTYTNRDLVYGENLTKIFSGDRSHYYLPNYPLVSVSKVEMRYFLADAWSDITGQPISWNQETGQLHFGYTLGRNPLQVRVTWTGGYWFEILEPTDQGYPSSAPAAVTANTNLEAAKFALPQDLQAAWFLQCRAIWASADKLGVNITSQGGENSTGNQWAADLLPIVCRMLEPHRRYQLT